jgi:hypothetical protein
MFSLEVKLILAVGVKKDDTGLAKAINPIVESFILLTLY